MKSYGSFKYFTHFCPNVQVCCFVLFISLLERFSNQHQLMVFLRSLSNGKSPQVSRTLLSILADLNSVVV